MSKPLVSDHHQANRSLGRYVFGFIASLILTVGAYLLVDTHVTTNHNGMGHDYIIPILAGLALVQVIVQLICFLHVGQETKPRWKLFVLFFAIAIIIIVVLGSLWIMANLEDHMVMPSQITEYMQDQEGF